jgi:hypothetical protein
MTSRPSIVDSLTSALEAAAEAAAERSLSCSTWAERHRVMGAPFPGPLTHRWHPWTRAVRDATARFLVVRKGGQLGFTEAFVDRALYDLLVELRDVLYVLPDDGLASSFSAARIDVALRLSPALQQAFTVGVQNVGHKQARSVANLYVRGSKARSGLKGVPCANLVLDELDEMDEANVELVFERVAGQPERTVKIAVVSTPTVPDFGVDEFFKASSQCEWFFPCPACGRQLSLQWPRNFCLERRATICHLCGVPLPDEQAAKAEVVGRGAWVPAYSDRHARCAGYWINQLYSVTVSAATIGELWDKAQRKRSAEQEFYNSKMALPHVTADAKVSLVDVQACLVDRRMQTSAHRSTMGVDVGKWYYWWASEWEKVALDAPDSDPASWRHHCLCAGRCLTTQELADVVTRFNAVRVCVDAQPETREVRRLQQALKQVWLCWIKEISDSLRVKEPSRVVDCNKVEWLDLLLDRVRRGPDALTLPRDVDKELVDHLQVPARVYCRDRRGNVLARYRSTGEDHYAMAAMLSEVAHHLPLASRGRPVEVTDKQLEEAARDHERGSKRHEDVQRYTDRVLEQLTGFRKVR